MTVTVKQVEQTDARLGRNKVHDSRSIMFPAVLQVDKTSWHDKTIRVYDPIPNPNQEIGCCTGVSKCIQFNAAGNRVAGKRLGMPTAVQIYSQATKIDPWDGAYPPTDTGSSGLAAAKAAQDAGLGGRYAWMFDGADQVVQAVMFGHCVSVGTWWYNDMFDKDRDNRVKPGGGMAGGHQWTIRGYNKHKDWLLGRCWWGSFRDFWIARGDLDDLLRDDGDAHIQERIM